MSNSVTRPRRHDLHRLRSYNQFPMQYQDIPSMTADLQRIRDMGFTNVWVNPLFEPCADMQWAEKEITRGLEAAEVSDKDKQAKLHSKAGSPYATRSFAVNPKLSAHREEGIGEDARKQKDYADIQRYTEEARNLGLAPMYDFVMRHIAVDNPLVHEKPNWFKRHPNGNLMFFGRDENYRTMHQSWDDVVEFNYDDPAICHEIVEHYLKPMANIVIDEWGFEGLRIDAAGKIPRVVLAEIIPYIDELCQRKYKKPALILGETLGQSIEEFKHLGGYMDYIYNSVYFEPFTKEFWSRDNTKFAETKGMLQALVSPTVGFPGNHDVVRLGEYYLNKNHIRGDLLKQVIILESLNTQEISKKPKDRILPQVISLFTRLCDKRAFTPEQLTKLVDYACEQKVIDEPAAKRLCADLQATGKLKQQDVRKWFNDVPPAADIRGVALFEKLMNLMFAVVRKEKEKEAYAIQHNAPKPTKIVSEDDFIRLIPDQLTEPRLRRLMKEAFCFTAFASDGGWFFSLGDEWGVTKRTNVFTASPHDLQERAYPNLDFSKFVRSINGVVAKLPPPSNPEWVQRCYVKNAEKNKSLASFMIHQGEGFSNPCHLVIANVSEEKQVVDSATFMEIKDANGRNNCPGKNGLPGKVYLCGDIELSKTLSQALERKGIEICTGDTQGNNAAKSQRISLPLTR